MKQGLNTINTYVINSQPGETVPLTAGTSSTNVKFALPASRLNYDVIVQNLSTTITAFVAFGDSTAVAQASIVATVPGTTGTINAFPVPPGAIITLQKGSDAQRCDTCAAITGSSTAQLYFTSIQGS